MIDFVDLKINTDLIKNPSSTFFARLKSDSGLIENLGNDDLLIIDKSVDVFAGALVVCVINEAFELRYAVLMDDGFYFKSIKSDDRVKYDADDFVSDLLWGVVIYVIKKV